MVQALLVSCIEPPGMSSLVDNWNDITPASFQPLEGYSRLEEDVDLEDKVCGPVCMVITR